MEKFNRILILGNGGAGKSTLARQLSQILSSPILHLDKVYWIHQWQKNDPILFNKSVNHFMQQEKWIIEGTPMRGLEDRIKSADLIIFLDINRIQCIFQLIKRRFSKNNFVNDGCPAINLNLKTLSWVWHFNQKTYPVILEQLKARKKEVFFVKNNAEILFLLKSAASQI